MMDKDFSNIADEISSNESLYDSVEKKSEIDIEGEIAGDADTSVSESEEKSVKFPFLKFGKAKEVLADAVEKGTAKIPNVKDIHAIVGAIGEEAQKATDQAKKAAAEAGEGMSDKFYQAKKSMDLKNLQPIFLEDLSSPDFYLPKMIRVVKKDKKHQTSEFCKESIGHKSNYKEMTIVNIYPEKITEFGLQFYPDKDNDVYYVNPIDRNKYIALDEYFNYIKIARINELQRIANDLGARYFKVTYKEETEEYHKTQIAANAKIKKEGVVDGVADHVAGLKQYALIEVAAEMQCVGHDPRMPKLEYFQKDPNIQNLIAIRTGSNPPSHMKFTLHLSNSSGIKKADAAKISGALAAMKLDGSIDIKEEAKREARKIFEYEIDF